MNLLKPIHNIWPLTKDIFLPSCPKGSVCSSFKRSTDQQYLLWLMGVCFGWQSWHERDHMACTLGEGKEKPTRHLFALHIRLAFAVICRSLFHFLHLLNPCHPHLRAGTIFFSTKSTIHFLAPAAIHILH